ncbi:MAG: hypothetical protein LBK06_03210 [Planctomycetaceae bacterium]|nr:hypothetical protein [Planctomycetaceae bacterium]
MERLFKGEAYRPYRHRYNKKRQRHCNVPPPLQVSVIPKFQCVSVPFTLKFKTSSIQNNTPIKN